MKTKKDIDDLQVWIPAQGSSQRIRNKNFIPFYKGFSLLDIAIIKLKKLIPTQSIYVSSESKKAAEIAKRHKVNFISRGKELTGNKIRQRDLFEHFFDNTPKSLFVAWVQVTDPLFNNFKELLKIKPKKDETIVLSTSLKKHTFYKNQPINFNFGDWHPVTQDIEPVIVPRWSVFHAKRETFKKYKYHFSKKNTFFISDDPYVDIDYKNDFVLAQILYKHFL
tara:strand:+ start:158 stop:823 length:666 start_codon:yes stop_codon:yes gene_type:complete